MIRAAFALLAVASALSVAACNPPAQAPGEQANGGAGAPSSVPGEISDTRAFSRVAPEEIVRFTGTEPFWGGQVAFTTLSYSTPDNPDGTAIEVERFAGLGGISWTGEYEGAPFTLAVTPGQCSDGMSERTYPYVATLQVQGEQRNGCAWSENDPFTAPPGYEG